jgi:S1-C subfamily serine protease
MKTEHESEEKKLEMNHEIHTPNVSVDTSKDHDTATEEGPRSNLAPKYSQPKNQWKKTVIAVVITAIVVGLLTSGGMAFAFLAGRQLNNGSIEEKRQTVVQEGEVIADISQRVGPSVVSIITQQTSAEASLYFGQESRSSQAAGTGFMIDDNGLILTNKHVVPAETKSVTVITADGTRYEDVEIIGRDPLNDLAILKVKQPKNFKAIPLADSSNVRTGQKVVAIGNALGQFQNTVTSGIISGQGRPVQAGTKEGGASEFLTNLFQTDAAINSGNSGGPLLNFNGEVIGVNTAVAADAENVGFSIPINEAKSIIASVQQTGKLQRPYIGIQYVLLTPDIAKQLNLSVNAGAYVQKEAGAIIPGSPAAKAGVEPGDVVTKVDSTEINEKNTPQIALGKFKVGDTVTLTVVRGDKTLQLKAKLKAAPQE